MMPNELERGTTAWLRALAERLWQIDYDLRCIGEVDRDNLTLEEERYVDSLLAELTQLAAPPEDEHDEQVFASTVNLPRRTYEAVIVGRRTAPSLIIDDDVPPAEQDAIMAAAVTLATAADALLDEVIWSPDVRVGSRKVSAAIARLNIASTAWQKLTDPTWPRKSDTIPPGDGTREEGNP